MQIHPVICLYPSAKKAPHHTHPTLAEQVIDTVAMYCEHDVSLATKYLDIIAMYILNGTGGSRLERSPAHAGSLGSTPVWPTRSAIIPRRKYGVADHIIIGSAIQRRKILIATRNRQ